MKKNAIIILTFLFWSFEAFSQLPPDKQTPPPLFTADTPVVLTLIFDMDRVLNDTASSPEYQPAILIEYSPTGITKDYNIKIKVCGNTRRKVNTCEFPPLKINFQRSALHNTTFQGVNKLKLVTHCREAEDFQNYALLEYQAYKIYNILTENSYRVRLANVRYEDSQGKLGTINKSGFFLEDDEMVAQRMDGRISDKKIWNADSCDAASVSLMTLFEFMIGNTDWWIHTRHNVEIIELADGTLVPVPYDFDYAGMVNSSYAVPSPILPIETVRQRFFKGFCHELSYYQDAIKTILSRREEILAMISTSELTDKKCQRSALKYLDDFFKIVQDGRCLEKYLAVSCDYFSHPENHLKYAMR